MVHGTSSWCSLTDACVAQYKYIRRTAFAVTTSCSFECKMCVGDCHDERKKCALGLRCSRKTLRLFVVVQTWMSRERQLRRLYDFSKTSIELVTVRDWGSIISAASLQKARALLNLILVFQAHIAMSLVLRWNLQIVESCVTMLRLCRIQSASYQRLPPLDEMELDALPFSSIPNFFLQSGQYHFALLGGISSSPTH